MAGTKGSQETGIIKGFNLEDIKRKRARLNASGGVDLVTAINAIDPRIAELKPTETIKVASTPDNLRKTTMGIVAKLSNLTCAGAPWAGRKFDVVSDPDDNVVYVQRGMDGEAKERKRGRAGGRPPVAAAESAKAEGAKA